MTTSLRRAQGIFWSAAVALCLWTVSGACSSRLTGNSGSGGAVGTGGSREGAGASGHLGLGGGSGGLGGVGGAANTDVGGRCGSGCSPTEQQPIGSDQFMPCGPTGPASGQFPCVSTCGAYRVVRWRDFSDTYACYYDQTGSLVSGRVIGTCTDPANFESGPDIVCSADGGAGASSGDAAGP
ncbi:MAG TPA: hypothetical protein VKZ18_01955 [Polyangia bacterium]|nr:hypothetical protein [Polyangia bacterium]